MPKKLSLIVPAYNKDSEVFQSVCGFVQALKQLPYDWEIVVVDDASRDKTLREALRSKKFNGNTHRIKVFSYNLNQGKGFALYYGFRQSQGDIILFADCDFDLPSENIPVILENFTKTKADITIGSKRHPLSLVHYPLMRKIMSKTYQLIVKGLFNLNVSDTQVGLKCFKREVLESCFPRIVVKRFAFDLELLVVARSQGFKKVTEAPIILKYNFTSTVTFKAIKEILIDTLAVFYRKNLLNYYQTNHFQLEETEIQLSPLQKVIV